MFELEVARRQFGVAFQGRNTAVETNLRIQLATCHTKTQRFKTQLAIIEHHMGVEVGEGQLGTLHNTFAGEFDVCVHVAPALSAKLFHWQHLACRLLALTASGLLLGVGVSTDQGRQVSHQQLVGHQLAGQLGPRLAGHVFEVAVNVTAADFAVEVFIAEGRATGFTQFGGQMAVSGVRRRIRQGHPSQRIKVAQAGAGQLQAQVQSAQIERIGQGPGELDMAVGNADLGLQRERPGGVLQCQQAANFAAAVEFLTVVLTFDLEGEGIVLWFAAPLLGLFRV